LSHTRPDQSAGKKGIITKKELIDEIIALKKKQN
jgi:hypothetical protein